MYCGSVNLTKLQSREILNLLLSSDEFELQPLITYIQETLIENHNDFIIKNISEITESIYQKSFLINYGIFVFRKFVVILVACSNPPNFLL